MFLIWETKPDLLFVAEDKCLVSSTNGIQLFATSAYTYTQTSSSPYDYDGAECLAECLKYVGSTYTCCRLNYKFTPPKCHVGTLSAGDAISNSLHYSYDLSGKLCIIVNIGL